MVRTLFLVLVIVLFGAILTAMPRDAVARADDPPLIVSLRIRADNRCLIDTRETRCDRVAGEMQSLHVTSATHIDVIIDDDVSYESVAATLNPLSAQGLGDYLVWPLVTGTIPSNTAKRWMRLLIFGVV